MGLTTALYTGLSGLSANSQSISVTGNNIANVNTTAFKSSRVTFATQISQTLRNATGPNGLYGGTNPSQVGLGTLVSQVSRNLTDGSIQPTGVKTDLAIDGNGFFIVDQGNDRQFTRAGTFSLDGNFNLVGPNGGLVQGYGVDDNFNVLSGLLTDLRIPLGAMTLAEKTDSAHFVGNLNAGGTTAANGSVISSDALYLDAGVTPASAASDLVALRDASGNALFAANDVITLTGARKGGASLQTFRFEITDPLTPNTTTSSADDFGATLQDFLDFLDTALGIDSLADPAAGVTVNGSGQIVVQGNTGEANDLVLTSGSLVLNQSTAPSVPLTMNKTQVANGESVRTTFVAYDSLGTPMTIDLTMVLEDKTATGTTWRYYVQSADDSDLDRVLGTGTLDFDTNGQLLTEVNPTFRIDRAALGAVTPQEIELVFKDTSGAVSALTDVTSQIASSVQDGSAIGTLTDFSVAEDGTIVGVFSNSLLRTLGRVMLAQFTNPEGLVEVGANMYNVTANSGSAQIVTPNQGSAGRVVGGALELSNVELSQEFVNLITASTGFSASSRVLTTSDRLIQELLATLR